VFIDPSGLMNIGTMGDREIAGWLLEIPKFKEQRIECQKQCYSIVKTPGNKKQLCMAAKCLKNCQAAYEAKCLFANKWINYWRTYDALDIAVERLANQKSLTTEQMLLLARTETNSPIIFSGLGTRKVNVIVDPNGGRSIFDPVSYSMKIGMVPLPISITVTTAVSNVSPRVAFRMAKIDAGVARSQQPILTRNVALTYQNGKAIITANGRALMSREYIFRNQYGNTVVIQRHGYGHSFSGGVTEPPHFNVRPIEDLRHGVVMGTKSHYYFEK
jgi:hypothetical protein